MVCMSSFKGTVTLSFRGVQARGVKMPSFMGYMRWSAAVLLPLFALIAVLFL